jgi:hypothetical protein
LAQRLEVVAAFDPLRTPRLRCKLEPVLRRLTGGLLIVVGIAGLPVALWSLFASGYMDEHPLFGRRAFAGVIMLGVSCVLFGVAIWTAPQKGR